MRTDGRMRVLPVFILCAAVLCGAGAMAVLRSLTGTHIPYLPDAGQLKRGDTVSFGTFEQDGETDNGPEAVPWTVLEVREDRALLLARDILSPGTYHDQYEAVTWEECTLRHWLNDTFLRDSFTEDEKEMILTASNENPDNPGMESHGCGVTKDKVFLLRMEEYSAYMRTEEDRFVTGSAGPTRYALLRHLETDGETGENPGKACWWLRTAGSDQYAAVFVDRGGTIHAAGAQVSHPTYCGIRPAVWVTYRGLPDG
ncbi:MAG: hypothetical protein IJ820_03010 [Lachnospiraceae bacterium]|nr:hypothetical protein [Lachnospiraceae bacterium]